MPRKGIISVGLEGDQEVDQIIQAYFSWAAVTDELRYRRLTVLHAINMLLLRVSEMTDARVIDAAALWQYLTWATWLASWASFLSQRLALTAAKSRHEDASNNDHCSHAASEEAAIVQLSKANALQ
jgi:hypothetical protein